MASFLGRAMRHPFSADNEAMLRLMEHPKTRDFARSLDYADLPRGWANDREIIELANNAYRQVGIDSPFFRAWYRGSRLVDENGWPVPFYHGSYAKGLRRINPDASHAMAPGLNSAFAITHPGVSLAYTARPDAALQDVGYQGLRDDISAVLFAGDPIVTPKKEYRLPPGGSLEKRFETARSMMSDALDDIREIDWKLNLGRLSKSYKSSVPGYAVPKGALESAVSQHLAHDLFLDANKDVLQKYKMEPTPFTEPALGEIYPLYLNIKNPLVVEGVPYSRDWTKLGRMRIDETSLMPNEREKLSSIALGPKGYHTVSQLYPIGDRLPTDELSAILRYEGDHDGLLMRGIYDGGGERVPPADEAAFHSSLQAKHQRNIGTFAPDIDDMFRGILPYAVGGGALAAAMGAPSSASAAVMPSGWVPPSAKADLGGLEPEGWMDPVDRIVDVATAGGGLAARALQAGAGVAQDWLASNVPSLPSVPEEYYEAAQ